MSDDSADATPHFVPDWQTCAHDDGRCTGRRIDGFEHCLAHLAVDDLDEFLVSVEPGVDLDLRGTTLTAELLARLLARTSENPGDRGLPARVGRTDFRFCHFRVDDDQAHASYAGDAVRGLDPLCASFTRCQFDGDARFDMAQFSGEAVFSAAWFSRDATFDRVRFSRDAMFDGVRFSRDATFERARFGKDAVFAGAEFGGNALFGWGQFSEDARFDDAQFTGSAWFGAARFSAEAEFRAVVFGGEAGFYGARFESLTRFGPLIADNFAVDRVSFAKRIVIEVEAGQLSAVDARFDGGVELRARYACISLQRTSFGAPSSLSGAVEPFTFDETPVVADPAQIAEWTATANSTGSQPTAGRSTRLEPWVPQLLSLQETDVSQLTLADVDLRWCRFAGAHQLDKLRLEGRSPFNRPPHGWWLGWAWPPLWRWSPRRVLAEEHPWRASRRKSGGWTKDLPDLDGDAEVPTVSPERLAVLYRSLRKALEDAKNEPGAGVFYYGEMEARRHSASTLPRDRALLTMYWAISGYGQGAGRALVALAVLLGLLFALLTQFGLPDNSTLQHMSGAIPPAVAGQPQQVTLEVKPSPATLPPPGQRWTADRMSKAVRIALGSVVFRDADQKLTSTGTWTVMAGRAFGPLLLALAALAIRARVKR